MTSGNDLDDDESRRRRPFVLSFVTRAAAAVRFVLAALHASSGLPSVCLRGQNANGRATRLGDGAGRSLLGPKFRGFPAPETEISIANRSDRR